MPLIHCNNDMGVGTPSIDAQHKKLLDMLYDLYAAAHLGKGNEVVGPTLRALKAYTVDHLQYEERLFLATKYPDAEAHAAEHAILTRKVLDIHKKFECGDATAVTKEVLLFLVNWIMDHTMDSDKKYSAHLIAVGIQ